MRIQPEVDIASIVLIGSFNPRIFRPEWFRATEIIGIEEAEAAKIQIIHEAISVFSLDWAQIRVEQNRFAIDVQDPPLIRAHDLVLKIFSEFLIHTPIHQMGINRVVHFSVGDFNTRDKIGKLLAPHDPWGEWGTKIVGSNPQLHGGMRALLMSQLEREDGYRGSINARVEPSQRPSLTLTGIYMEVNDHFVIGEADQITGSVEAMAILESQWLASMQRSEGIIDQIMALKDRVR